VRDGSGVDLGFGPPALVEEPDGGSVLSNPVITPDDLTMYFATDTTGLDGGPGQATIRAAARASTSDPFSAPASVSALDFIGTDDVVGVIPTFVTADGCTLYFYMETWSEQMPFGTDTEYFTAKLGN